MIKNLSPQDLPREKLIHLGSDKLDSFELLALVLRNGTKDQDVMELSRSILSNYQLNELVDMDMENLLQINGIGIAKAAQIQAINEIGKRVYSNQKIRRTTKKINSSKKVIKLIQEQYKNYYKSVMNGLVSQESLLVIYLDNNQNLIRTSFLTNHLKNKVFIANSFLIKECILNRASYVILVHNHIKDKLDFSKKDKISCIKLNQLLKTIEVKLLDFIIFNRNGHISINSDR